VQQRPDDRFTPVPVLARTPEEVLAARVNKPTLSPNLEVLEQKLREAAFRRLPAIGVDCPKQFQALRARPGTPSTRAALTCSACPCVETIVSRAGLHKTFPGERQQLRAGHRGATTSSCRLPHSFPPYDWAARKRCVLSARHAPILPRMFSRQLPELFRLRHAGAIWSWGTWVPFRPPMAGGTQPAPASCCWTGRPELGACAGEPQRDRRAAVQQGIGAYDKGAEAARLLWLRLVGWLGAAGGFQRSWNTVASRSLPFHTATRFGCAAPPGEGDQHIRPSPRKSSAATALPQRGGARQHRRAGRARCGVPAPLPRLPGTSGSGSFGRRPWNGLELLAEQGIGAWQLLPLAPPMAPALPTALPSGSPQPPGCLMARIGGWGFLAADRSEELPASPRRPAGLNGLPPLRAAAFGRLLPAALGAANRPSSSVPSKTGATSQARCWQDHLSLHGAARSHGHAVLVALGPNPWARHGRFRFAAARSVNRRLTLASRSAAAMAPATPVQRLA